MARRPPQQLGFPTDGFKVLGSRSLDFADIAIEAPGSCSPSWRWHGREHALHKRCGR
jgi:hypothetical protein